MTLEEYGIEGIICAQFPSGALRFYVGRDQLGYYTTASTPRCWVALSPHTIKLYADKIALLKWSTPWKARRKHP